MGHHRLDRAHQIVTIHGAGMRGNDALPSSVKTNWIIMHYSL